MHMHMRMHIHVVACACCIHMHMSNAHVNVHVRVHVHVHYMCMCMCMCITCACDMVSFTFPRNIKVWSRCARKIMHHAPLTLPRESRAHRQDRQNNGTHWRRGEGQSNNRRECAWLLRAPNGREGSSEQLLERLLRRHPIQHLGQNHLVNIRAQRSGRTCGRHGRSMGGGGGGSGQRASSDLGFLGPPMVGPTVFQ